MRRRWENIIRQKQKQTLSAFSQFAFLSTEQIKSLSEKHTTHIVTKRLVSGPSIESGKW